MGKVGPKEWKEMLEEMGYLEAVPWVPSPGRSLDLEMVGKELTGFWEKDWLKKEERQRTKRNPPCS